MAITVPTAGDALSVTTFGKPVADEINRITPITTVSAWTAVTFQNGWLDYAGGYQTTQYRKIGDIVYVRGLVKGTAGSTTIFTLPTGFRPLLSMQFPTEAGGAYGFGTVYSNGAVNHNIGSLAAFNVNFSFSTT